MKGSSRFVLFGANSGLCLTRGCPEIPLIPLIIVAPPIPIKNCQKKKCVWINTYENTIFRGMNIHFNPAILMWTTGVLLVLTHCQVCCMQKKCPHFLTNPRNGWLGQSHWWSSSPLSSSKHPHSWYWCWNPRYVWISKTVFWVNSIKFPLKSVFDPIKSL